jgi:hypothetical protein
LLYGAGAVAFLAHGIVWGWPKIAAWWSLDTFSFILHLLLGAWASYQAITGRRGWILERRRA